MCDICDGESFEDGLVRCAEMIRVSGFMVMTVEDPGGWSYTIGLEDSARHPEVIVVGGAQDARARFVHGIATSALGGEHYHAGDTIGLGDGLIARVGMVDPIHFELETFARWQDLADIGAIHRHKPRAVQILLPTALLDGAPQPVLADPSARVGSRGPNRQQRRAQQRRNRH
jgi:hypothetical protein